MECKIAEHIRRDCPKNQQQRQAPHQWQGNAGHKPGQLIDLVVAGEQQIPGPTGPLPILKIDIGRMMEKHLKSKNQSQEAVELELKMVKEVVRRDPTLRVSVKRIAIYFPLELIKVI
jgi:hypothetical protein